MGSDTAIHYTAATCLDDRTSCSDPGARWSLFMAAFGTATTAPRVACPEAASITGARRSKTTEPETQRTSANSRQVVGGSVSSGNAKLRPPIRSDDDWYVFSTLIHRDYPQRRRLLSRCPSASASSAARCTSTDNDYDAWTTIDSPQERPGIRLDTEAAPRGPAARTQPMPFPKGPANVP